MSLLFRIQSDIRFALCSPYHYICLFWNNEQQVYNGIYLCVSMKTCFYQNGVRRLRRRLSQLKPSVTQLWSAKTELNLGFQIGISDLWPLTLPSTRWGGGLHAFNFCHSFSFIFILALVKSNEADLLYYWHFCCYIIGCYTIGKFRSYIIGV